MEAEFAEGYTAPFCLGPARECFCCGSLCNKHHGCWYNCKQCCCDDLQVRSSDRPGGWRRSSSFAAARVRAPRPTLSLTNRTSQHPRVRHRAKNSCTGRACSACPACSARWSPRRGWAAVRGRHPLLRLLRRRHAGVTAAGWTVASRQITDTVNAATNRFGVREKVPWLCDRSETDGCRCGTFWCPYCVIVRAQMEIRHRARAGVEVGHGIYRPQPPPHVMRMSDRESTRRRGRRSRKVRRHQGEEGPDAVAGADRAVNAQMEGWAGG